MLVVITIVALAFAVQEHNDRVLSEELTETASALPDTVATTKTPERDERLLSVERLYRRPHLTSWASMTECVDITRR